MVRDDELEVLEQRVAKMRALGVKQWGDLILDDPPADPATDEGGDDAEGVESFRSVLEHPDTFGGFVPWLKRDKL